MARGEEQQGKQAVNQANTTAGDFGSQASAIGGPLVPQLQKQATNPTGFTPTQQNNMLVAGEQGAGGANAGIVGQAGLAAARTHDNGALSSVLDSAARAKTQQLSQNALGVANQNANLQVKQQADAQKELAGLYGTDVGAQLKAQQLVPEDLTAEEKAGQQGWLQNTTDVINTLTGAGKAAFPKGLQG
jgi:hypothetical protein